MDLHCITKIKINLMAFTKVTEQPSHYRHLETMTVQEVLTNINNEDKTVPRQWRKPSRRFLS